MSKIKDTLNLHVNKINESRGMYLTNMLTRVQVSLFAFEYNYRELNRMLVEYTNPRISSKLFEVGHKERVKQYLWHTSRLLQNFLSSASTFKDHIRYITKKIFANHKFLIEYETRIKTTFANDPLSNFIIRFRNNYSHTSITGTKAVFRHNIDKGEIISEIILEKSKLSLDYEWNSQSKKYLDSSPDEIILRNVIDQYYSKVMEFYKWYEAMYFQIYEHDFKELADLKIQFNELYKTLFNIKK